MLRFYGWGVVDDPFDIGVRQQWYEQAWCDDGAGGGFAEMVERVDPDRDGEQRSRA